MLAAHGELDEKFLWMSADEYERWIRLSIWKLFSVFLLPEAVNNIHIAEKTSRWK